MNSLTDLREVVDVVIGVDTHVHTHSAAVVDWPPVPSIAQARSVAWLLANSTSSA